MALYNAVRYKSVRLWANVELADTGQTKTYPVTHLHLNWPANEIPTAIIQIPYGLDTAGWAGGDVKTLPSNLYSHYIEIYLRFGNETPKLLFYGYIRDMAHRRGVTARQGNLSTVIRASHWIGLMSQQFVSVVRGLSPVIYTGNPWFHNAVGIDWNVGSSRIADSDNYIGDEVILALQALCTYQQAYNIEFQSGTAGAARALWALNKYTNLINPQDNDSYICSDLHNIFDQYTRDTIALSIGTVLNHRAHDAWEALVAFCLVFGFIVVPRIDDFIVVPFCRPAYDRPRFGSHHVKYTLGDIEGFDMPISVSGLEGRRSTPLRMAIMVDRHVGPWGQTTDDEVVAGYDVSELYSESDARFGRVLRVEHPRWFPSVGSGIDIATSLCKQAAIDEAFSNSRTTVVLPYISGVAPGSLVELKGTSSYPILGDRNIFGIVKKTQIIISIEQKAVRTRLDLSHVMQEDLFEACAFKDHWICNCHFLHSALSNSIDYNFGL